MVRLHIKRLTSVADQTYVVTFDYTDQGSDIGFGYGSSGSYSGLSNKIPLSGSGTKTYTITPSFNGRFVGFYGNDSNVGTIDNVSVRLAEEDRSVNGNGLQVFGSDYQEPCSYWR